MPCLRIQEFIIPAILIRILSLFLNLQTLLKMISVIVSWKLVFLLPWPGEFCVVVFSDQVYSSNSPSMQVRGGAAAANNSTSCTENTLMQSVFFWSAKFRPASATMQHVKSWIAKAAGTVIIIFSQGASTFWSSVILNYWEKSRPSTDFVTHFSLHDQNLFVDIKDSIST